MVRQGASLVAGTAISTAFVLKMDDLMYTSLRRNVVLPVNRLIYKESTIESKEIMEIGSGAGEFLSQFKPRATERISAKRLLIDDNDYSTTQDHYFGYINRRQEELSQ